jgi:hypothetical protein
MTKTKAANNAPIALTLLGLPFSIAPFCKLGVPVTEALAPEVAACSLAGTMVYDVTVLRLPLGSVVVKIICFVVEVSAVTVPEVIPAEDSPADVEVGFELELLVDAAPEDDGFPVADVPEPLPVPVPVPVAGVVEPCEEDELAWLD